jgi:hypothetical protein
VGVAAPSGLEDSVLLRSTAGLGRASITSSADFIQELLGLLEQLKQRGF